MYCLDDEHVPYLVETPEIHWDPLIPHDSLVPDTYYLLTHKGFQKIKAELQSRYLLKAT